MRQRKADICQRVNGSVALRFTKKDLTSHAGLELFRCFLKRMDFSKRLWKQLRGIDPAGDYGSVSMVLLVMGMMITGGRRLHQLAHISSDPLVKRFCGLRRIPTSRTVGRWLSRCTSKVREALLAFNSDILADTIRYLQMKRITVDVDGTVLSTGLCTQWANRGYNPHHRKCPSYYPITAHLAQTGQILRVKNRSGNVHDGRASMPFFRDLFHQIDETILPGTVVEVRLDGAFFRRDVLGYLDSRAEYAVKVPFWKWVGLKPIIQARKRWKAIAPGLEAFETTLWINPWNRELRVAIFRKRTKHKSAKNYQLDLFDPSNGHWEYSAIATNKSVGLKTLWLFQCGRGSHEKILSEIKTGYAFDAIPSRNYAANSTWQILSVLAHNLVTHFQIETGAPRRHMNAKRSPVFTLKRISTLRYEFFGIAGIFHRPEGRLTLSLSNNHKTRRIFEKLSAPLVKAA